MDKMIYTAMTGANAAQYRQQVLANNLANVSTAGFRAELSTFRAVPVRGDGASTRVFALEATPGHSDLPGAITSTGRNLDVTARGNAYFAVQGLDGTEAYTRAGSLDISNEGLLVTRSGLPVQGDGGPINVPQNAQVTIGGDGTVSATLQGGRPQVVGRLKLVTPEAPLLRGDGGLFRAGEGDLAADATARLQAEALEGSNVSPVESMVAMIAAARQYEQQMKMLQTSQEREQSATRLLSGS